MNEKKINWPEDFRQMSSEEWMEKMRTDPIFYFHRKSYEMQEYEELLLKLVAEFLGRTLILVPLLEEDSESSFKPSFKTEPTKKYYIACCNKLQLYNFFLNIFYKTEANISCFSFCWKRQRSDLWNISFWKYRKLSQLNYFNIKYL